MKKAKAPRVPVLENAFEVNLPKLMRAAKAAGDGRVVLTDGTVRTVAILTQSHLAVSLGGRSWIAEIAAVQCLKGRLRPLLKCPRAHEGNFQSLYYREGELACRHCHKLRYQSTLAATETDRVRIARLKLLRAMGGRSGAVFVERTPYKWRRRHLRLLVKLAKLSGLHYQGMRAWLTNRKHSSARVSKCSSS